MSEQYLTDDDLLNLPFGPLTPEAYARLGQSFFDASQTVAQQVAAERGITASDYMAYKFQQQLGEAGVKASKY